MTARVATPCVPRATKAEHLDGPAHLAGVNARFYQSVPRPLDCGAMPSSAIQPPRALPLRDAIAASEPLARLGARLRESSARFDCARSALPVELQPYVAAGPIDDSHWTLLAANSAVAAKLRHLLPAIEAALSDAGWPPRALRVRVRKD